MSARRILLRFTVRRDGAESFDIDFALDSELTETDKQELVRAFSEGLVRLTQEFTADPKLVSMTSNGHVALAKEMVLPPTQNWPGDPEDDAA